MPEVQAEFCITGLDVSPAEITQLLGISPTKTWHLGDTIQETLLTRKHNGWCLSTTLEKTSEVTSSIQSLLQILLPKSKTINHICKQYAAEAEISCTIYLTDETPAIHLSQEIVSQLAELNAAIDIDIILIE